MLQQPWEGVQEGTIQVQKGTGDRDILNPELESALTSATRVFQVVLRESQVYDRRKREKADRCLVGTAFGYS